MEKWSLIIINCQIWGYPGTPFADKAPVLNRCHWMGQGNGSQRKMREGADGLRTITHLDWLVVLQYDFRSSDTTSIQSHHLYLIGFIWYKLTDKHNVLQWDKHMAIKWGKYSIFWAPFDGCRIGTSPWPHRTDAPEGEETATARCLRGHLLVCEAQLWHRTKRFLQWSHGTTSD